MTISNFILKFKIFRILFLFLRYIITSINVIVGCFMLNVLVDKIFPFPIFIFHIYWIIICLIVVVFFLNFIKRIYETLKYPYKYLQEELIKNSLIKHKDELINAYLIENLLFSSKNLNFSKELSEKFTEKILEILKKINFSKITGFDRIKKILPLNIVLLLIIFILYFLPPQVIKPTIHKFLFTRRPDILGIFITPKNIKVPYGENCVIKIIVEKGYELYKPELFIKAGLSEKFIKVDLLDINEYKTGKIYKYEIDSVIDKIFYKVKFRGITSKVYTIEPIVLPEISDIKILIIPPSYTKLKPYQLQSFNEDKILYNSEVEFKATLNKDIDIAYLNIYNRKIKLFLKDKRYISGNFKAIKDCDLSFEIFDMEGLNNTLKYQIKVFYDKHPEIEIISPEKEIVCDKNIQIPIVYTAKDDFGILKVKLIYRNIKKNDEKVYVVKEYKETIQETIDEYIFDLSKLNLDFGDIINYYFVVYDNDETAGYKTASTEEYKIEIFSYERQHETIQKEIQSFIEESIIILSKEIELKEKLSEITTFQFNMINELTRQHEALSKNFDNLNKILDSILDKMLSDPYTSIDTYMEFKNLQPQITGLKDINSKLTNSLKQNDLINSSYFQDQIINTLERATMLSEKIMKRQNMQNISSMIKETTDISKDLLDYLNKISNISKDDIIKLNNLLKEIEDKLNKIANMFKNMSKNLPEEFINRRDVQNIDFYSPMDLLSQLYNAVSKGDINSAIRIAEALMKHLNSLSKTLMEASSDVLSSQAYSVKEKLSNIIEELDKLISSQQEIYDETKIIDDFRIKEILKLQEKLLEEIMNEINRIITKIRDIESLPQFMKFINKQFYKINSERVIENLNKILMEIKNKKLLQTPVWINEAIIYWQRNVEITENIDKYEYNELILVTKEIKDKLDKLNNIFNYQPEIEYPTKLIEKNNQLYDKQNKLIEKTEQFIESIKSIGKESFIVSNNDILLASQAKAEMQNSKNNLSKFSFPEALQSQNNATNLLLQLKNNFSEKYTMFEQLFQSIGQAMSSKLQMKSSYSSGQFGILTGRVTLPSAKEYIPPKELREDIIKSLSEKYPEELKKVIEEYYRKILK